MTREEAFHVIDTYCVPSAYPHTEQWGILQKIKEALEVLKQEPCEDTISRQGAIDSLKTYFSDENMTETEYGAYWHHKHVIDVLMKLPPVKQEPKTGHWKSFTHSAYHGIDDDREPIWREVKVYHCNLCNRRTVIKENYCPNCGARMESEE